MVIYQLSIALKGVTMLFKRKPKYPKNARYKLGDYVNFRFRGDLYFGYVYGASEAPDGTVTYTLQIAGQCPALLHDYREEDIIGLKTK